MNAEEQIARIFRDDEHRYWLMPEHVELTGVSALLEVLVEKSPWYEEYHRDRGSLAHAAIELALRGELDRDELDPQLVGYVKGAEDFVRLAGVEPVHVEPIMGCARRGLAGQADLMARPRGRGVKALDVIDFKTGDKLPVHALQTAAYTLLSESHFGYRARGRRFTVHVKQDGTFKAQEWRDPADFGVVEGLAGAVAWRRFHLGK